MDMAVTSRFVAVATHVDVNGDEPHVDAEHVKTKEFGENYKNLTFANRTNRQQFDRLQDVCLFMFPNITLAASKLKSSLTSLGQRLSLRRRRHNESFRDDSRGNNEVAQVGSSTTLTEEYMFRPMAAKRSRSDGDSPVHPSLNERREEVLACLRSLCREEPATLTSFLTDGILDNAKVIKLAKRPFGSYFIYEGATVDEVLISMARLQNQEYKKDARCWRYKSSQRRRCESILSMPSVLNVSETDLCNDGDSNGSQTSQESVVAQEVGILRNCLESEECAETPPHVVTFPPTPTVSVGDISISFDGPDRPGTPIFNERVVPSRLGGGRDSSLLTHDGHVSDVQEELSDSEMDRRDLLYHHGQPVRQAWSSSPCRDLVPGPQEPEGLFSQYQRLRYSRLLDASHGHGEDSPPVPARRSVSECTAMGHHLHPVSVGSQRSLELEDMEIEMALPRVPDETPSADEYPMVVDENRPPSARISPYRTPLDLPRLGTRPPPGRRPSYPTRRSDGEDDDDDLYN